MLVLSCAAAGSAPGCQRQGQSAADAPEPDLEWRDAQRVATGDAHRGPWRMNDSDWRFVDDGTVALGESGHAAVAWADHARQDVLLQIFEPGGGARLDDPKNISESPGTFSWLPRVEVSGGGERIDVLWQEIVFSGGSHGGEIFFSSSEDGGRTFRDPENLSRTEAGAGKGRLSRDRWHNGSFDLVRAGDGTLYAAWTEFEGRLWVARSPGGDGFADPVELTPGDAGGEPPARAPSLALAPEGDLYAAWTVGEDASADIRVARSEDGGRNFGSPDLVAPGPGHADAPELAVTSDGTLHLVYASSDHSPPGAYDVLYTQRPAGAESFSEPASITGDQGDGHASLAFPDLVAADDDELYAAWHIFHDRGARPRGFGLTAASAEGDFGAPSIVPGSEEPALGFNGSQQGLLMRVLAVSGDELALAQSTFNPDRQSAIWLRRAARGASAQP